MRFILFWIHEQHSVCRAWSDTWPRIRINYPFPSYFEICFMFHISFISFIIWNRYLYVISIAILAVFAVHRFVVRWIIVQRFIVWWWHIIVYKMDNLLCYILYFRLIVTIIRITGIYNIWCVGSHVSSWHAKMLIMLNSCFADFYWFLQFPRGNTQFNYKHEVKCGENCPRQLLFRFMTILKRKHIVKSNSVKSGCWQWEMGWLRTVKLEYSKMGSYWKYAGYVRVKITIDTTSPRPLDSATTACTIVV